MDFTNKKILVVGFARSGKGAVHVLLELKAYVTVNDKKPLKELGEEAETLLQRGVTFVTGDHPADIVVGKDAVIVSPGVPPTIPPLQRARELGIPVWSEVEFAYVLAKAPILAITGSNGKSTTTALVGEMVRQSGFRTVVAGNIGIPLSEEVFHAGNVDVIVAEVSSFQLEGITTFAPRVSAILNLTENHLDRHKTMAAYRDAKARVLMNQKATDYAVLNFDDPLVSSLAAVTKAQVLYFSRRSVPPAGTFLADGEIRMVYDGKIALLARTADIYIRGRHNLENALAACCIARAFGCSAEGIQTALRNFKGLPHRFELVANIAGVEYINDSKATTPTAAIMGLNALDKPIILIAGGRSKGTSFTPLAEAVARRVKYALLLGEAADELAGEFIKAGFTRFRKVASMAEAVQAANGIAESGDTVLLAPACTSWDMYTDFEARGRDFAEQVKRIGG